MRAGGRLELAASKAASTLALVVYVVGAGTAVVSSVGCGGASAVPSPAADAGTASAAADSPAAKCLALANADRTKKPGEPDVIQVSHVLVKHVGSKNAPVGLTRTREAACLRALEVRDKLVAGAAFDALVTEYSDEPGAASRAGSLGPVHRADVLPAFADAAFELDRGQLSDVVETEFGFHVLLRTE